MSPGGSCPDRGMGRGVPAAAAVVASRGIPRVAGARPRRAPAVGRLLLGLGRWSRCCRGRRCGGPPLVAGARLRRVPAAGRLLLGLGRWRSRGGTSQVVGARPPAPAAGGGAAPLLYLLLLSPCCSRSSTSLSFVLIGFFAPLDFFQALFLGACIACRRCRPRDSRLAVVGGRLRHVRGRLPAAGRPRSAPELCSASCGSAARRGPLCVGTDGTGLQAK